MAAKPAKKPTKAKPRKRADKRGAAGGKFGNEPHVPTDERRFVVQHLTAIGYTQAQIALVTGLSVDTLDRHYRAELNNGALVVNAKIAGALYKKAMAGETAAQIWWTKARMGWKATESHELSGTDGGPIQINITPDDAKL